MNISKIVLIVGLLLSVVVGVGVAIPHAALALAILGLVLGLYR